ncbi:DUF447 domain-containing protein [Acidianus manzaensis]|uniref:DUF447 domain-containing protein n=1 Tax=Acidianus manzaensis TaxID=282676 RepID=A0A1W6K0B5_9CREN|nr:DUF447 domain-containing protein [Acidianus manzaensis]ARM75922.1 hypothetical protein B6F84_07705 [Acidianus manzaensis]
MNNLEVIKSIFPHDGIYETILGTNGDKGYNLSPIGIIVNNYQITSKIYKNTITYYNILRYPYCSINILNDPKIFYYLLFNRKIDYDVKNGLPKIGDNVLFGSCEVIEDNASFILLEIKIFDYDVSPTIKEAFSRGDSLFIDMLVHITRLDILPKNEVEELIKIISYEMRTIKKISPNLGNILDEIKDYINSKGFKLE